MSVIPGLGFTSGLVGAMMGTGQAFENRAERRSRQDAEEEQYQVALRNEQARMRDAQNVANARIAANNLSADYQAATLAFQTSREINALSGKVAAGSTIFGVVQGESDRRLNYIRQSQNADNAVIQAGVGSSREIARGDYADHSGFTTFTEALSPWTSFFGQNQGVLENMFGGSPAPEIVEQPPVAPVESHASNIVRGIGVPDDPYSEQRATVFPEETPRKTEINLVEQDAADATIKQSANNVRVEHSGSGDVWNWWDYTKNYAQLGMQGLRNAFK